MKINSSMHVLLRDEIAKKTLKIGHIPFEFLQVMTLAARKIVLRRAKYLKKHPLDK